MSQKNTAVRLISFIKNLILAFFALILILVLAFPIGFYGMAIYLEPSLPKITELKTMTLEMPLQIYTADRKLIGQYGNRFSLPVAYEEIPKPFINAFLAAEDDTFFEHSGISVKGLGRAITEMISATGGQTGGSSITQQVAKNYFLSPEQTFERKLNELFIARKIENELTKNEIFTLYVNKIYLGQGAYGIRAAAKRYFSKSLENLTIAEMAMLAGLPKAPSEFNPVVNPERALTRRNWIIGRMLAEGYITQAEHDEAIQADIGLNMYQEQLDTDLPYIAELARSALVNRYGEEVMNSGWRVQLTVNSEDQKKADEIALRHIYKLDAMNRGRYRGVESLDGNLRYFKPYYFGSGAPYKTMYPAKITKVLKNGGYEAVLQSGKTIKVARLGMPFAISRKRGGLGANIIDGKRNDVPRSISVGNVVRVVDAGGIWVITQPPRTQTALVSINPQTGALEVAVGGFHFNQSKFNRSTQGYRQPGSIIKPLIYAAAIEYGKLTPSSVISNAPISINGWRPKNAGGGAGGAVTVSGALARSLNLPSIRIMQRAGMEHTHATLTQMGLEKERLPHSLTLALGATDATPLQMATGYSTIINGGHRVQPYVIERIYDFYSQTIYQANPARACASCFNKELSKLNARLLDEFNNKDNKKAKNTEQLAQEALDKQKEAFLKENPTLDSASIYDRLSPKQAIQYSIAEQAPRILSATTAFQSANMLRGVMTSGTGRKGNFRGDIGGKTGTTNQAKDVWFAGVQRNHVAVVWIGYDDPAPLGGKAYGGTYAMPLWAEFMRYQLAGEPVDWVKPSDFAKTKKTTQKVLDITDENEAEINALLTEAENMDSGLPTDAGGDDFIPEGDGEDMPESDTTEE